MENKEIYGMIHLAGPSAVEKALEEIKIYEEEGVHGVIIENYHGSTNDVIYTLKKLGETNLKIGINILPNEYVEAFKIAKEYNVDFIQLDYISGKYKPNIELDIREYGNLRINNPQFIMGGVWPKYYQPVEGSNIYDDLNEARMLADAIVVTGSGTGKETPLDKVKQFKQFLDLRQDKKTKLIVGAGVTKDNILEHFKYADGAIIGSAFKPGGNTMKMIDRDLVRDIMLKIKVYDDKK